jgi:hypothetical protein
MIKIAPLVFPALWLMWALYWQLQARRVKVNVWRESTRSRLMHIVPLLHGAV